MHAEICCAAVSNCPCLCDKLRHNEGSLNAGVLHERKAQLADDRGGLRLPRRDHHRDHLATTLDRLGNKRKEAGATRPGLFLFGQRRKEDLTRMRENANTRMAFPPVTRRVRQKVKPAFLRRKASL